MTRRSCAIYATGIVCAHLLIVGIALVVAQVFQTMIHSRLKKVSWTRSWPWTCPGVMSLSPFHALFRHLSHLRGFKRGTTVLSLLCIAAFSIPTTGAARRVTPPSGSLTHHCVFVLFYIYLLLHYWWFVFCCIVHFQPRGMELKNPPPPPPLLMDPHDPRLSGV